MSRRTKARLVGAIRLVPDVDSIGVPVFLALRGNATFVPEMDGDFRIRDLLEFYNEQGFQLSYDLPDEYRNQTFEVGASAPVPFWVSGTCHVILGDADKNEPEKLFGPIARENPVLVDIARLLDDARSGRINDRFDEWAADTISNGFPDVFYETPIRSRYWVTRYRVAVAKARATTQPPHPIDARLRQVGTDWFRRFGTKTDLSKVGGMLGNSANQIFTKRQITDILFAFLMNKFAENDIAELDAYLREPTLHKAFPSGLYYYYLENGWPRVPFNYTQEDIFLSRMNEQFSQGFAKEDLQLAAKLSLLLFGRAKLPQQVESLAHTYMKRLSSEFKTLVAEARAVFKNRDERYAWPEYADAIIDMYDELMDLDGILNGKDRMKRQPANHRFGVTLDFLRDVKSISRGDW